MSGGMAAIGDSKMTQIDWRIKTKKGRQDDDKEDDSERDWLQLGFELNVGSIRAEFQGYARDESLSQVYGILRRHDHKTETEIVILNKEVTLKAVVAERDQVQ